MRAVISKRRYTSSKRKMWCQEKTRKTAHPPFLGNLLGYCAVLFLKRIEDSKTVPIGWQHLWKCKHRQKSSLLKMVGAFFSRKRKTFSPPKSFTFKRALLGHRTTFLSKPTLLMKKFWWSVADIGKSWNRAFSNSAEHYFQSRKQNEEYLFFPCAKRFPHSNEKKTFTSFLL